MADTTTQTIGLPIGKNGSLVQGTLIVNKNGDTEWYQGIGINKNGLPTFTSNKSDNYKWQPSPNCTPGSSCPTETQKQQFYSNENSVNVLNDARLKTFKSTNGFNSPTLAKQLNVPGSNTGESSGLPQTTSFSEAVQYSVPNPEIKGTESTDFSNEIMRYPFDSVNNKQDYLKITAIEYRVRQISGGDFRNLSQGFSPRFPENEKIEKRGTCYLPIQPVILDQNVVNWGPENMDAFSALFAQASYAIARKPKQTLKGFEDFAGALGALGGDANVQNALRLYLAGAAVGNQSFFTRITGAIINPNLELLFNGPALRTFNYSFRLSPRNTREAKSVRTIIRFFKEMSAVRTANNALFLKSPNIFKLEYFKGSNGRLHPSLNKIKTCALTSMTVNYTPDNSYMTFVDEYSTMTSYDMALTFQELEPVYDKDYKDLQDKSEIGF
jgi:hypothetical protein